jgi:hypothetical protein
LFFLDITTTATDSDIAMKTVSNTINDGNSAIVGEGSGVFGVFVGDVDGLGVDGESVVVGVGLRLFGEAVGLGVGLFVGDGLLVLAEL